MEGTLSQVGTSTAPKSVIFSQSYLAHRWLAENYWMKQQTCQGLDHTVLEPNPPEIKRNDNTQILRGDLGRKQIPTATRLPDFNVWDSSFVRASVATARTWYLWKWKIPRPSKRCDSERERCGEWGWALLVALQLSAGGNSHKAVCAWHVLDRTRQQCWWQESREGEAFLFKYRHCAIHGLHTQEIPSYTEDRDSTWDDAHSMRYF